MGMKGMNPIIAIFAIIGGLIVLGLVLRVAFALIGLAVVVGAVLVIWYFVQGAMGKKP
jgi:hypothetical protein